MSLLNEMLKDLNEINSKPAVEPIIIPPSNISFLQTVPIYLPWIIGTIAISLVILLVLHGFAAKQLPTVKGPKINKHTTTVPVKISLNNKFKQEPLVSFLPPIFLTSYLKYESSLPAISSQVFGQTVSISGFPDIDLTPPDSSSNSAGVNKVFARLTPQEWHEEQLNKALDFIEKGDESAAIRTLDFLLFKFPHSVEARESLAAIYISQNATKEAMRIVDEGLYLIPNSITLNTMKARMLFEEDQVSEALSILEQFNPNIKKDPDFFGLRAAVLQAVGRESEAGSLYKLLVELEPTNGQYWLGFGIALENKKSTQQAVVAYRKAIECFDVDPSVRAYAENRIKTLQG
jgi:MSHA biogenesis protein MshN